MTNFVQFRNNKNEVVFKQLDSEEKRENDEFIDAVIYEINEVFIPEIKDDGRKRPIRHYLTFGSGSQGGGSHFKIIQIFKIEDNDLVFCKTCFDGANYYIQYASRRYEINLDLRDKDIYIELIDPQYDYLAYALKLVLTMGRYEAVRLR